MHVYMYVQYAYEFVCFLFFFLKLVRWITDCLVAWNLWEKRKGNFFFIVFKKTTVLGFYKLGFRVILVMITSSLLCDSTLHTYF